jgi:hypothetical protein
MQSAEQLHRVKIPCLLHLCQLLFPEEGRRPLHAHSTHCNEEESFLPENNRRKCNEANNEDIKSN